ncbi:Cell division control protein 48 B [Borealophlyctis nickersoniae]|nr:Cell division control protein 48 B [Borealophlyctis nickersoniae]
MSAPPLATHVVLRKKGLENPWIPTTAALARVREEYGNRRPPIEFLDWEGALRTALDGLLLQEGAQISAPYMGEIAIFHVTRVICGGEATKEACITSTETTEFELLAPILDDVKPAAFGGFQHETDELLQLIETALHHNEVHARLQIPPIHAILLTGPSGVGKSALIDHVTHHVLGIPAFRIRISEISAAMRTAERRGAPLASNMSPLLKCIEKARLTAPAVVVLEGLEILDENFKATDIDRAAIASHISNQLRRITPTSEICALASAVDVLRLPIPLRRNDGGGFDRVLELVVPSRQKRQEILHALLDGVRLEPDAKVPVAEGTTLRDAYASKISQHTAGFVSRDLALLISRAIHHSLFRTHHPSMKPSNRDDQDQLTTALESLTIDPNHPPASHSAQDDMTQLTWALESLTVEPAPVESTPAKEHLPKVRWSPDIEHALKIIGPSQGTEIGFETKKPDVRWESIGGYDAIKRRLIQLATWPLERPDAFERLGIRAPAGVLLYGPSGCGKTMLVRALASNSPMNFISVKGNEIYSKYLGESEHAIRRIFAAARRLAPCILFLDEMDSTGTRREWSEDGGPGVNERVLSTLLNEMDGVQDRKGVLVVACTNRPWKIDDALLRPGRLDHHLYVTLPTRQDRVDILRCLTTKESDGGDSARDAKSITKARLNVDVDLDEVVDLTDGFSGADLSVLLRESAILSLRSSPTATSISHDHILAALKGAISADVANPFDVGAGGRGWWRPASVGEEEVRAYERFKRGRE